MQRSSWVVWRPTRGTGPRYRPSMSSGPASGRRNTNLTLMEVWAASQPRGKVFNKISFSDHSTTKSVLCILLGAFLLFRLLCFVDDPDDGDGKDDTMIDLPANYGDWSFFVWLFLLYSHSHFLFYQYCLYCLSIVCNQVAELMLKISCKMNKQYFQVKYLEVLVSHNKM